MRNLVSLYLRPEGHQLTEAANGSEAVRLASTEHFDLIILDLMLPDFDGFEVCRRLRANGDATPIIMLTARGQLSDRIEGLRSWADDYIVKPFDGVELAARVAAVLRRTKGAGPPRTLSRGPLTLDTGRREAELAEVGVIPLTRTEFDLLLALAEHPGQVLDREQLLNRVWGADFEGGPRTVDTHVKNLRDKLGPAAHLIATVWGVGYKFEVAP